MALISLNELKEGNIVKPQGGVELLYVTEIGRNADKSVKNYVGYPVTDTAAFVSGSNIIPISQTELTAGSHIRDLNIKEPVILVGNRLRRIIPVDENNYLVDLRAKTNVLLMQEVVSVLRQTGANEERIEQPRSPRGMDFERFTGAAVAGEGRFADTPEKNSGLRKVQPKPARTESIVLDMYLEDAVEKGLIDRKTYTVLQFGRDEIVTLRDAWNAVEDGTLSDKLGLTKTFDKAFPFLEDESRAQKRTIKKREGKVAQNPIINFMGKIGMVTPVMSDLGLISQRTEDIVSFNVEASTDNGFVRYDEAMIALVARRFNGLEDPKTELPLSAKDLASVKQDIEGSFNASLEWLTKDFDGNEILTTRKAFMAMATSEEHKTSILRHHDFSKPVVTALGPKIEAQRAEIIANRPAPL